MTLSYQYGSFKVLTPSICTLLRTSDVCRPVPSHEPQLRSITRIRVYRVQLLLSCLADLGSQRVAGKKNVKLALWTSLQRVRRVSPGKRATAGTLGECALGVMDRGSVSREREQEAHGPWSQRCLQSCPAPSGTSNPL